MAEKLIKCPVCGAEMAAKAKSCPSCGAKNKKPIYKKWWFWVIAVFLVIGIVGSMVVSYNRDNSGEKPLRRKALRACRIGAPVRCRRGQYGTTPFLQTG